MKVEKLIHTSQLLDLYGSVLNDNQREVLHLYLDNNLSLIEIAERTGVTRQAVSDVMVRAIRKLENLDKRLHLIDKYRAILREIPLLSEKLTQDVVLQEKINDEFLKLIKTLEA